MEPNDALEDLRVIRQVMEQTRRSIAVRGGGYFLIIWGVVWLLGFLNSQFLEGPLVGRIWLALDAVGVIATFTIGYYLGTRARVRTQSAWRWWAFWPALWAYGFFWLWLLRPADSMQAAFFLVTLNLFGFVTMGLWLMSGSLIRIGIGVTILASAGYFLIPAYFFLWMALLGGGTLIGSGVYISRRWR